MLPPTHTPPLEETGSKDAVAARATVYRALVVITERMNRALHRSEWVRGVNLPVLSGWRAGRSEIQV